MNGIMLESESDMPQLVNADQTLKAVNQAVGTRRY
jgi:hypothetical protein